MNRESPILYIQKKGGDKPQDEKFPTKTQSSQILDLSVNEEYHDIQASRKTSFFEKTEDKNLNYLFQEEPITANQIPLKSLTMLSNSFASITTYLGIGFLNCAQMMVIKESGSTINIAAFGLGITWINASSYAILMSLNDGIRTVSGQVYGSKNYNLLGIIYNQSIAITFCIFMVSLILILNSQAILIMFGINPIIAKKSSEFTFYAIPSLIASLLHPIWCYIFIIYLDYEIKGAGIARSITFILSYLFVLAQMKYKKIGEGIIQSFNFRQSFYLPSWWNILKVAVPAGGTNYLKWLSIEVLTILIGNLPNPNALAGHAAFFSINIFFSMFAKGLQTTVNTFISNAVGEGRETLARNITIVGISSTFIMCLTLMLIGKALEPVFIKLLCTNILMEEQFRIAFTMYVCIDIWCNFLQQVIAGVLSGINRQNDTISYYLVTFGLIQFVVGYTLGFQAEWGLAGVWCGRVAAGLCNCICFFYVLHGVDLKYEIQKVQERLQQQDKSKELGN